MNNLLWKSCRRIVTNLGKCNYSSNFSEKSVFTRPLVSGSRTLLGSDEYNFNLVSLRRINLSSNNFFEAQSVSLNCWNCGGLVDEKALFCPSCSVVQKPRNVHYFEVVGMTKSFNVDVAELTKNFRHLQSQLHPDKFTQKSKDEKEISEYYSTLLNTAYKTLLSPLERGLYLLELEGYPLFEGEIMMSPEFLYEVMEVNEELDYIDNLEDLKSFKETNNIRLANLLKFVFTFVSDN